MTMLDRARGLLRQALGLRVVQHHVIAANLTNAETPGERADELRPFGGLAAVRQSQSVTVQVTHPRHRLIPGAAVQSYNQRVSADDLPRDANSVSIDVEMAKLSDNIRRVNRTAESLARKLQGLLNVIHESR